MNGDLFCLVVEDTANSINSSEECINQLGFDVIKSFGNTFSIDDLQTKKDLIIQKIENRFLLYGFSLHKILNKVVTRQKLEHVSKHKLTLHIVHQNLNDDTFFIAYFEDGRPGPSHQVLGLKKKCWTRTFTYDQLPVPHSQYVNKSIRELSDFLEANIDLVERIYTGMHGKGNYGLGFHKEKNSWVACKKGIVPDDSKLQEISQYNYQKKGEPFIKTLHPSSQLSFLNQTDVSRKIHQKTIENLIGFKACDISEQDFSSRFELFKVDFIE